MKPVREIISRQIIDDLWDAGYTILPRARHPDPFFVPPEMVPQGRPYQWMHLVHDKFHFESKYNGSLGWAPVPASRHDGYFMPAGHVGDIEVNGLGLFEKPKFEVDADHANNAAKAKQMVNDWAEKNKDLFGEVSVNGERTEIGATKTIEDVTKIPRELTPYIAQIFEERDRLANDYVYKTDDRSEVADIERDYMNAMAVNPDAGRWPTLHAIILPKAIENIRNMRQRIIEEATSGQASEH